MNINQVEKLSQNYVENHEFGPKNRFRAQKYAIKPYNVINMNQILGRTTVIKSLDNKIDIFK